MRLKAFIFTWQIVLKSVSLGGNGFLIGLTLHWLSFCCSIVANVIGNTESKDQTYFNSVSPSDVTNNPE